MTVPEPIRVLAERENVAISLLVQAGSKSYGIDVEGSDDDYVGVFIPRLRTLVSINGIPRDTYAENGPDFTIHEIGKFCALALKGNPAILETLWSPMILHADEWGRQLVDMRSRFLHQGSLAVYVGYAESQLKKMVSGKGLHAKGSSYNGKYGAHMIRLLHAGIGLAERGDVMVRVEPGIAELLLDIRAGKRTMDDVLKMARPLLERLKTLSTSNSLPADPAREEADDLVARARLSRNES